VVSDLPCARADDKGTALATAVPSRNRAFTIEVAGGVAVSHHPPVAVGDVV
jgi:hypothetical protein